jgi:hypothetical protein
MMAERDRPFSDRCPHASHDRLQADAVFHPSPKFRRLRPDVHAAPRQPRPRAFFERGAILLGSRIGMARPRLLDRIADRDQGLPSALVLDRSHPWNFASQRAILGPDHSPPSSGGVLIRSLRAASASGVRMVGLVPKDTFVASRRATDANGSSGEEGRPVAAATRARPCARRVAGIARRGKSQQSRAVQLAPRFPMRRCRRRDDPPADRTGVRLQPNPDQLLFGIIPLDQALLSGRLQTRTH